MLDDQEHSSPAPIHADRNHDLVVDRSDERFALQQELREQPASVRERLYNAIVESSDDAIFAKTLNGMITAWNPGAERLYGYTAEEAIGQSIDIVVPEVRRAEIRTILDQIGNGQRILHFDTVRRHKDGVLIDVSITVSPVRSAAGDIVGASVIARDISERVRADARFRLVVEASPNGMVMTDAAGRIVLVNAETERLFGYTRAELIGQPLELLVPLRFRPADPAYRPAFTDHPQTGAMGAARDLYGLRKDGSEFPIEIGQNPIQTSTESHILSAIVDMTARKRTEAALRESEQKLSLLFELLPVGVAILDADRKVVYTNAALQQLIHLPHDQAASAAHDTRRYIRPDGAPMESTEFASMRAIQEQRAVYDVETGIVQEDGNVIWANVSAVPVAFSDWKVVITAVNITNQRQQAEQLRQSQKMEAIGRLAGGIAHDFNNILTAIIGNVHLARADLVLEHPVQESLAQIEQAATRATEMVQQILAFSHQREIDLHPIKLQAIIREAFLFLQATLPSNIEIVTLFGAQLPAIMADATQMHQIFMNLATNAAHAMRASGGRLEVQVDVVNVDALTASLIADLRPGSYVCVTVSDSGHGMNRITQQQIFDPFFSTKGVGEGTGLGLSVVHGIIKDHGGAITVYSEPGKGTLFRIYFPAIDDPEYQIVPKQPASAHGQGKRVLYIDDEEALVSIAKRMLARLGYAVTGYSDAIAALEAIRSGAHEYDVIVTDLAMPGVSGFDLAREVHAIRPDLPIILTSGYVRAEDEQSAQQLGIRGIILKPNSVEELGRSLNALFHDV